MTGEALRAIDRARLRLADGLVILGLVLFMASALHKRSLANAGLLIGLLGLLVQLDAAWRDRLIRPLLAITAAYLGYLLCWMLLDPAVAGSEVGDLMRRGALPVLIVAWGLHRRPHWVYPLLALALLGFAARVLLRLDAASLAALQIGAARAAFGDSAINFGLWSAIAVLGLALFAPLCFARRPGRRGLIAAWALLLALFLAALALSGARSAWLACALVLPVVLARWARDYGYRERDGLLVLAVLGPLLLAIAIRFARPLRLRLLDGRELPTVQAVWRGEWSELPATSVGNRLRMYHLFWQEWRKAPLFGHGPGSAPELLAQAGPALARREFVHFHCTPCTSMVELGLLGLALHTGVIALVVLAALQGRRRGRLEPNLFWFILGALALFTVVALFNDPLAGRRGPYVLALIGALAYAWRTSTAGGTRPGAA